VVAERAQKRGGGQVRAASDFAADAPRQAAALDAILSRAPTPEMVVSFAEECERFLNLLEPDLRALAMGKLDGFSNQELAAQLQCGLRTVERRLNLIRKIWNEFTETAT
jgi:DNA-directed RNA polymerase specialized sigma24 family protein